MTLGEAFPPELPPTRRYTLCGEPLFEEQIKQDLSRIAADSEFSLSGAILTLLLVGRFARGEGSVVLRDGDPVAFEGYQCVALADRSGETTQLAVDSFEKTWSKHLRVPVRIHICQCHRLSKRHDSLWWLDIGRGNVEVLSGDPMALGTLHSVRQDTLRSDEAGWLLCEQATLLAMALHDTSLTPRHRRYRLHCLTLACGDAELLLAGRFVGGVRARQAQLQSMVSSARARAFEDAVAFLTRPDLWHVEDEDAWQTDTLSVLGAWHLDLEHRRAHSPKDVRAFVRHRGKLFEPETPPGFLGRGKRLLGALLSAPLSFPYVEDPLERLARAAVGLTYARHDASTRLMCARLLGFSVAGTQVTNATIWTQLRVLYAAGRCRREEPVVADYYA